MKLNKPNVTESQTELESYVASLLIDEAKVPVKASNKVTPLRKPNSPAVELVKETVSQEPKTSLQTNNPEKQETKSKEAPDSQNRTQSQEQTLATKQSEQLEAARTNTIQTNTSKTHEQKKVLQKEKATTQAEEPAKQTKQRKARDNSAANQKDELQATTEKKHSERIKQEFDEYSRLDYTKESVEDPRLKNVEKLLGRIALASAVAPKTPPELKQTDTSIVETKTPKAAPLIEESQDVSSETVVATFSHRESLPLKDNLGSVFQTLVFEVNKLPLAVPLVKLGGIVNLTPEEITPLVGTPDWFMGLVPNERGNLMVVDTQKFLMPEQETKETNGYQYLIVLDNSRWALACHSVGDAKNLTPDDIRWSSRSSKRPWFAGMVVQYMSALVEVDELINMLAENIVD